MPGAQGLWRVQKVSAEAEFGAIGGRGQQGSEDPARGELGGRGPCSSAACWVEANLTGSTGTIPALTGLTSVVLSSNRLSGQLDRP